MDLRPLGFGEIFDRAITLFIRNFVPFFGMVLVIVVPTAFFQYYIDAGQSSQMDRAIQILEHPGANPSATARLVSPGEAIAILLLVLLTCFIWPFVVNAVAVGVARSYRGRPIDIGACYKAALERWAPALGLLVLEILIVFAWYVALLFAVFLAFGLAAAFFAAWVPLGIFTSVAAALALVVAFASILPLVVALTFAMYSVVLEELRPIPALRSGFARIFTRTEFWRAVLFGLAAGAVSVGISMGIMGVAWIALMVHAVVVEVVLTSLLRAASMPFGVILMAVYYYDVRIRREGYDLEAALDRLSMGSLVA